MTLTLEELQKFQEILDNELSDKFVDNMRTSDSEVKSAGANDDDAAQTEASPPDTEAVDDDLSPSTKVSIDQLPLVYKPIVDNPHAYLMRVEKQFPVFFKQVIGRDAGRKVTKHSWSRRIYTHVGHLAIQAYNLQSNLMALAQHIERLSARMDFMVKKSAEQQVYQSAVNKTVLILLEEITGYNAGKIQALIKQNHEMEKAEFEAAVQAAAQQQLEQQRAAEEARQKAQNQQHDVQNQLLQAKVNKKEAQMQTMQQQNASHPAKKTAMQAPDSVPTLNPVEFEPVAESE